MRRGFDQRRIWISRGCVFEANMGQELRDKVMRRRSRSCEARSDERETRSGEFISSLDPRGSDSSDTLLAWHGWGASLLNGAL